MSEEKEIEWESWGVQPSEDGVKRQRDAFVCPYCSYQPHKNEGIWSFLYYLIGYSSDENFIVMECPDCFGKFYRHPRSSDIKSFTKDIEYKDKSIFRVPDVYEELSEMLEKQKKKK